MPPITATIPIRRGIDNKPGGAYFCSNMKRDPKGGVLADYALTNLATQVSSTVTEWLKRITKFVQREYGADITIFGRTETNGDIVIFAERGTKIIRAMDYSQTPSVARGLAIDSKNEVVYTGNRYIGRTVTSVLDGQLSAGANAIDVISATSMPTSGYAVIKSGLTASETVHYTGITTNQLTGVTRGKFNTTDATHASGLEIIAFDDDWKDLGAAETLDLRPLFRSEDMILAGNVNKVAGYIETDGSDYSAALLTLPSTYKIVDFSEIVIGGVLKVIIAVNKGNKGSLIIWDKATTTTWDREIPVEENIKKLEGNLVGLESGIWKTDGYDIALVKALPDDDKEVRSADFDIFDMKIKETFLLVTAHCAQYHRNRTGLWILDMESREWFYVQPSQYGGHGTLFGAIFISSGDWRILVSTDFNGGAIDQLSNSARARGNYYQIIYDPQTASVLNLSRIKLHLITKLKQDYDNQDLNFDVVVRYYDFKRPFLQRGQLYAASANTSQMVISDVLGKPQVGDRVEIIERTFANQVDVAGAPRNVTAVVVGTGKFTLTLDDPLPAKIDAPTAANSLTVIINPLKKIVKRTINALSMTLEDLEIPVEDEPGYKKLMIEVEIRHTNANLAVGLSAIEIISNLED